MTDRLIGTADHPIHLVTHTRGHSRRFNSKSGNPRYTIVTDDGMYSTARDAAFACGLTNSENLGDDYIAERRPLHVILHIDAKNEIHGITFLDDDEMHRIDTTEDLFELRDKTIEK